MNLMVSRRSLVRILPVIGCVGLLVLGTLSALGNASAHAQDQLDQQITATARQEALSLAAYFERARSINLVLARNDAFRNLYADGASNPAEAIGSGSGAWTAASRALAHLNKLYRGSIGEACLIDRSGREISRTVRGQIAKRGDLSPDESANPFFAPTFDLDFGEVYHAEPYVSPDTGEWVISNSTLMPSVDGAKRAIVHFEVTIESFRAEAAKRAGDQPIIVVDRSTGLVVIDSRSPQEAGEPLGSPENETFRALADARFADGIASVGGHRVAYARVSGSAHNVNDWIVVVPSLPVVASPIEGLNAGIILMISGSFMLMLLAVAGARGRRRDLRLAATTDPLTGLPNRVLFADRVDQGLLRCRRDGSTAAVLLIDLDGFKEVNDTLGHAHGDQLLQAVGQRLVQSLRESDTIARLGGDEFGVLMHNADQVGAIRAAESLASALEEPILSVNIPVRISASVGIAIYPHHGEDFADLVQHADVAMYEAKARKVLYTVYSPTRDPFSRERLGLLADLPRAIEQRQLMLHYQPKVDLAETRTTGVEALVRWCHPELGLIPPAEFVPLAEETGMIDTLTSLVLDLALEQVRAWHDDGLDVGVSVNIPERSLVDIRFPSQISTLLRKWDLPASVLTLELTESAFVSDPERAISNATSLREVGAAISIDDFGSGYSSLAYLRDLPVDELKIDRSFVSKMLADDSDSLIVHYTIALAHGLGLRVVAEGVEQPRELEALRRLGCDVVQGFLFSRPVPGEELTPRLLDGSLAAGITAHGNDVTGSTRTEESQARLPAAAQGMAPPP